MKKVNIHLALLFFAATLIFSCGTKTETDSNKVAEEENEDKFKSNESENDAAFVAEAVAANYAEIEMAVLAGQKSDNSQVKEVAKELEAVHNKQLKELQSLAEKKSISIPVEAEANAKRKIENMAKEEEVKDFNEEWCKEMADKHEKSIKEFEARWEKTEDADLKNWISETLPHLRSHLDKVKACDESIKQQGK